MSAAEKQKIKELYQRMDQLERDLKALATRVTHATAAQALKPATTANPAVGTVVGRPPGAPGTAPTKLPGVPALAPEGSKTP